MPELNFEHEGGFIIPDGQKTAGLNVLSMRDEKDRTVWLKNQRIQY